MTTPVSQRMNSKTMTLKLIASLLASSLLLQACATVSKGQPQKSTQELTETLKVYPDNAVAYVLRSGINSPMRVWATENIVLALKFRNRLINAKDISSMNVFSPPNERMFRSVVVQLKSGEKVTEDYLKPDAYAKAGPQWVACTLEKVCTDLVREAPYGIPERFPGLKPFLVSVSEDDAEQAGARGASKDAATIAENMVLSRSLRGALPALGSTFNLKFGDVEEISNLEPLVRSAAKLSVPPSRTPAARWQRERDAQDAYWSRAAMQNATNRLRKYPTVGAGTNCGTIFEVRLPQVGVTTVEGPKFITLADLYAPGVACYLVNGKYDHARTKNEVEGL